MIPPVVVLAGPTGVGKTAISIPLARHLNAQIISADSRQIYRHMNIATAKPSQTDMQSVPHHLIDVVNPDETYSAGQFGTAAREILDNTDSKFMIIGGSGLYIKAIVEGLTRGIPKDEITRKTIRDEMASRGMTAVYNDLQAVDPEIAARISPNDARRIERALEVYRLTGIPLSRWHAERRSEEIPSIWIGLTCDRNELYRRIELRIDRMMENDAVVEETKRLLAMGFSSNLISMEGLGYRDIVAYLNGQMSREDMIRRFKQDSRNYAKRQLTWFRKEKKIHWIDTTQWNPDSIIQSALSVIESFH
jgi:tRNA dimethylallyltransferase